MNSKFKQAMFVTIICISTLNSGCSTQKQLTSLGPELSASITNVRIKYDQSRNETDESGRLLKEVGECDYIEDVGPWEYGSYLYDVDDTYRGINESGDIVTYIRRCRLYNVPVDVIQISFEFSVNGMRGKNGIYLIEFYDADGITRLTATKTKFTLVNGKLALWGKYTPKYDNSLYSGYFSGIFVYMPYNELRKAQGTGDTDDRKYKEGQFVIFIQDEKGRTIATSEYYKFHYYK